jgi:hypothetical protein
MQALNLLLQTLLGVSFLRPLFRSRHASHGTPIDRSCTDPVNSKETDDGTRLLN